MALDIVGVKYEADVSDLQKGLDEAVQSQVKLGKQAQATGEAIKSEGDKAATAMDKTSKSTKEASKSQVEFQGALGETQNKLKGLLAMFKAIVANPIVLTITALVGAFTVLYKAIASTDSGGTKLQGVFTGLKDVVDVVLGRIATFAQGLGELFSGNFTEASNLMGESIRGVGEEMRNAAAAGYEYEQALDALIDKQVAYSTEVSRNLLKIAELEAAAMDRTKGVQERRKALEEAMALETNMLKFEQDMANERYNLETKRTAEKYSVSVDLLRQYIEADYKEGQRLLEQNKNLNTLRNNIGDDGEKDLREHYNKTIQLQTQFFEQNRRNIGKITGFEEEERIKAEARREKERERVRKAEEKRINDEFTLQQLRINVMQEGIGKEIAARDLAYEREKLQFKDNKGALLLIEQKYWQDIEAIRKKYQAQEIGEQEVFDEELIKQEERAQEVIKELLDQRIKALLTPQEYEQRQLKQHYDALRQEVGDNEEALALINEDFERKKAEVNDKYRAEEMAKNQAALESGIEVAQSAYEGITAIGEMLIQDEAKRAEFMKAMTLFKLGISTAEAISKATASAAGVPFPANIAAIALAVGTVLANIAAAKQALQGAQAPAFKDGVIDLQGPGTGTSDSIPAWLSKGESVMTNKETKTFKDELKAMRAGNYADLITAKYVLPVLRAQQADTAQRMAAGMRLHASLDDERIVAQLGRIKPATSKDIERLGNNLSKQWKDTAYRNSKTWKA